MMPAIVLVLLLAGSAQGSKKHPLSWQEIDLPTTMDPLDAVSPVDFRVHALIYDQLYYADESEGFRSDIFKYSTVEPDGRLHAVLGPPVRWHDGQRLRAADICRSIERLKSATDSPLRNRHPILPTTCEVDEQKKGVFVAFAQHPLPDPRAVLAIPLMPTHLAEDHDLGSAPIGTGPMKATFDNHGWLFKAWDGSSRTVSIPAMRLVVEEDRAVQVRNLIKGTSDGVIGVPPKLLPDVREAGLTLRHFDQQSWWSLALNTQKEPLSDPAVRELLDRSLDREALREALITTDPDRDEQQCTLISGPFPRNSPRYNRGVPLPGGLPVATLPLGLRIAVPDSLDLPARAVLDALMASWRPFDATGAIVGPDADLNEFDIVVGTWSAADDLSALYHTPTAHRGLANVFGFSNKGVDRLFRELDGAVTDVEIHQLSRELHAMLADERTHLFLWELNWWSAWRPGIEHQLVSPGDYFSQLDQWTIP